MIKPHLILAQTKNMAEMVHQGDVPDVSQSAALRVSHSHSVTLLLHCDSQVEFLGRIYVHDVAQNGSM